MNNDSAPVTTAELHKFMAEIHEQLGEIGEQIRDQGDDIASIKQRFTNQAEKIAAVRQELGKSIANLNHQLTKHGEDIINQVNILDENLRRDVFGAFEDRFEQLREVQQSHGKRLNRLEAVVAG